MSARLRSHWGAPAHAGEPTPSHRLWSELRALGAALASPQSVVREVEAMASLWAEARRVEAHDPARAEALRREAATHCR
jgi:hypothetical protein